MNFENKKFLPIGTVVLLKNGTKKVMINGFLSLDVKKQNKIYDYTGCLFPEGIIASDKILFFDHDQIEKIYYFGCWDKESQAFNEKLIKVQNDLAKNNESN